MAEFEWESTSHRNQKSRFCWLRTGYLKNEGGLTKRHCGAQISKERDCLGLLLPIRDPLFMPPLGLAEFRSTLEVSL